MCCGGRNKGWVGGRVLLNPVPVSRRIVFWAIDLEQVMLLLFVLIISDTSQGGTAPINYSFLSASWPDLLVEGRPFGTLTCGDFHPRRLPLQASRGAGYGVVATSSSRVVSSKWQWDWLCDEACNLALGPSLVFKRGGEKKRKIAQLLRRDCCKNI